MMRKLISMLLLGLTVFSLWMYFVNSDTLKTYKRYETKKVVGTFDYYKMEVKSRMRPSNTTTYFHFKLKEFDNVFVVPSPEWSSFDFKTFKRRVDKNSRLEITIDLNDELNDGPVGVYQIKHNQVEFVDWTEKVKDRRTEGVIAFVIFVCGICGLVHHTISPWM